MPNYRAEAIVLRTQKLGEADRIITWDSASSLAYIIPTTVRLSIDCLIPESFNVFGT